MEHLKSQITEKTSCILVCNPSNPCGSCFTKEHMLEIIAVADDYKLPLICDEVYYGLSYDPDRPFYSFAHLTDTVPMICVGSLAKIYCVPGWRLGWMIVYNRGGYLDLVLDNLGKHSMIQIHPSSIVQAALPRILDEVPTSHFEGMCAKLKVASE